VDEAIANHSSDMAPALAGLGPQLHLVHRGERGNTLWHSWWTQSGGERGTWGEDATIPNVLSSAAPGLASYQVHLHLVHTGETTTVLRQSMWTSGGDQGHWSDDMEIPDHTSDAAPALAAHGTGGASPGPGKSVKKPASGPGPRRYLAPLSPRTKALSCARVPHYRGLWRREAHGDR
jgi:hypothetical protein